MKIRTINIINVTKMKVQTKKMKMIFVFGMMLFGLISIQAQNKEHYLHFNTGYGFHNLKYNVSNGNQDNNFGNSFNLGYNYFFSPKWGIGTGIGIETFQTDAVLNYQSKFTSIDSDDESFEFRTDYQDWKEQQNVMLLEIPLGFLYKSQLNEKWKIQLNLGSKIVFDVKAKSEIISGAIETKGYYSQYNIVLSDMPQHNFKTINEVPNNDVNLNPAFSAFADLGGLYRLKSNLELYFGAYVNYGFTNMIDAQNNQVYQEDGIYNGVLNSEQTNNVIPFTYGFKLGLNLNISNKKVDAE